MDTLTRLGVVLPKDREPTKTNARDIISSFLTKEWQSVDPETLITSYDATCTNAHCVVERPKPTSAQPNEPLKVFIKFHNEAGVGDIVIFKHLLPSKQEEALLSYEFGQSGRGPKVYGFFETQDGTLGRVDEFLDARNLEPEDVEDADIRADIAQGLATFHAMKTSLQQRTVESYYDAITAGLYKYHKMDRLKALASEGGVNIDDLIDYDFGTKLRNVVNKLQSLHAKTAWCIHDVQFMNVMVRNNANLKEGENRTVLIDFEVVMRNYRALDIGGHFMQKMFKWFDEESKVANCRPYTDEEKGHFCEEYAKAWNGVTGDSDTGEQVLVEAEYGYLLAVAFDVHNMLCFMDDKGDRDPLNLVGLNKLLDEFKKQYGKLGLQGS